jgi:uncharacterized membrane protein
MPELIDSYLARLKEALAGCDPATIQDALSDAEEHLRTALDQAREEQPDISEPDALQSIIGKYGTPEEIAVAYREIEANIQPALAFPEGKGNRSFASRFFDVLFEPRAYAALLFMIFSLVTGIFYFAWTVTFLSMSAGFMILIIGIPFFGLVLLSLHGLALVEGRIVEALLGERMPRRPIFSRKDLGAWGRFKSLVKDKKTWTTIAYMILMLPLGILYFTLFIVMISLSLWGILRPVLELGFHLPYAEINGISYYTPGWFMPVVMIFGFLWVVLTMHLAKAVGRWHGRIAKVMLVRD